MRSNYFQISSILLLFNKAWAKFTESIPNAFLIILIPIFIFCVEVILNLLGCYIFIPGYFTPEYSLQQAELYNDIQVPTEQFLTAFFSPPIERLIGYVIAIPLSYFYMAYTRSLLNATKDMKKVFSIGNFYSLSLLTWIKFYVAYFLIFWLVILGLIFFILPGLYIGFRLAFTFMILLDDKSVGIFSAMSKSWKLTSSFGKGKFNFKNHFLHILGIWIFMIAYTFVSFSGLLLCCVGVAVTAPLGYLAYLYLYRHLSDNSLNVDELYSAEY
tara:strand:- start:588 stop:1400 length:813 start_codon:yes stop_codon:yes gene_type:complete